MTAKQLVSRLEGVTETPNGWQVRCPAHGDERASLSIREGPDGRILLKCFAGCSVESIVGALGLKLADLFPPRAVHNCKRIVETYDYTDENRTLLFQNVRYDPKDFRQRCPDPNAKGRWIWNLKDVRRVLYRLPDVLKAIADGELIVLAEGEKDVAALVKHGFCATCNPGGAGKWLDSFTETLRGADVVIIPDNDEPGRKHAELVAARLKGKVTRVRVVTLPRVENELAAIVKDAADFFGAGGTAQLFRRLTDAAPEWTSAATKIECSKPTAERQEGHAPITPARWFAEKFSRLAVEYGAAILEETNKQGVVLARDIGEDFLAATLGDKGCPDEPTVFIPTEEKFYTYSQSNGIFVHQREPVLLTRLSRLLLDCARACWDESDTRALEFRLRDSASLNGVLRKARGLLEVSHDFFASDLKESIACANGMLRLKDKALLSFSPSYRRRNKLAVPFDPSAKCPLFLDTLMRPALDDDDLDLLQRACGLFLIGENLAQKILVLTGTAGGGKGTFVRILNGIIGSTNLASLRPQLLGERFELGRLLGKTLLYGADVPEDFLNQRGASVLKSLTGYDPVTLEFKNSNESPAIICRFNVIVTCNSRLTVRLEGDVEAWRRRLCLIDYHNQKPHHVIPDLDQRILTSEGPGVLNWMLDGLDMLRRDGWQLNLTGPQQETVDNLLLESDGYAVFAREFLKREAAQTLTVPDCFAAYVEYCSQRGWTALPRNKFTRAISDEVVRQFSVTSRHDIRDGSGKAQIGWKGLSLVRSFAGTSAKRVSELSESGLTDTSDTVF